MCSLGVIKRVFPFLATLLIGLFIASFFVDLTPRPFAFPEGRRHRCHNYEQMYYDQLDRADQLQKENDRLRQNPVTLKHTEPWTAPDLYVPPVPKAPRSVR
jgi:hypothetical protein